MQLRLHNLNITILLTVFAADLAVAVFRTGIVPLTSIYGSL